jgi:hypothetical protein
MAGSTYDGGKLGDRSTRNSGLTPKIEKSSALKLILKLSSTTIG